MDRDCSKDTEETVRTRLHLKHNNSKSCNFFSHFIFIYSVLEVLTYYGAHTEVREELEGGGSFLPLCGFQEWSSGCQA